MRSLTALGIVIAAALAAMALVGTSTALAGLEDEIALCKILVEKKQLCPTFELWPEESVILALAPNIKFVGAFTVECEDSLFEAFTQEEIGFALHTTVTSWQFGKLPTPKLGEGCTTCTQIHALTPFPAAIETPAEKDEFFLNVNLKFLFLGCTAMNLECTYSTMETVVPISHTGVHKKHEGNNLTAISFNQPMTRLAPSSAFCPTKLEFVGKYVVTLVHWHGESGLGWPALDVSI